MQEEGRGLLVRGPRGCCYENSHKDRLSMIKGLAMLCKRNWRREKNPKRVEKKSLKKGQNKTVNFNQNEE